MNPWPRFYRHSALTSEEGSAMAGPTLSALEYLHQKGYTLGRTEPSNILAVGDTLKLSAEEASHTGTPADDMFAFGTLLLNALTGGTGALEGIQEPLHGIVKHCIDPDRGTRWTAGQALRWLAGEPVRELPPRPHTAIESERPERGNHKLIYGMVAALLLMAGLIWYARRPAQIAAPQGVASAPSSAVTSNVEQPVTREPVRNEPVPPPAPAEHAQREPAQTAPMARHDRRSESWVVVIASYGARGPAEKRTRETAKRWPRFHVELVEAASEKARLLVVIGRNLSEKEAEALRSRARSSGLPRDTYIKRIDTGNG